MNISVKIRSLSCKLQQFRIQIQCAKLIFNQMDPHSQSDKEEEQFNPLSKSTGKRKSKTKEKKEEKEKEKNKKGAKKDNKKQPKKKKQSKVKSNDDNNNSVVETVRQYMQKQNRPYNLLNIYDNLRGSIKKPLLESALEQLKEEGVLDSKDFGKVRIYMLNQSKFNVDPAQLESLNSKLTEYREQCGEHKKIHKQLLDQHKKIASTKTNTELRKQLSQLRQQIAVLQFKKNKLVEGGGQKISEQEVGKAQKQKQMLLKEARKRKRLTKQCLQMMAESEERKIPQMAQLMGVQL